MEPESRAEKVANNVGLILVARIGMAAMSLLVTPAILYGAWALIDLQNRLTSVETTQKINGPAMSGRFESLENQNRVDARETSKIQGDLATLKERSAGTKETVDRIYNLLQNQNGSRR